MGDQIPEEEKTRRLTIVQEKQRAIQIQRNAQLIGGVMEVMVEGRNQALGQWIGRTSCNRTLNILAHRRRRIAGGQIFERARDAVGTELVSGRNRRCGVIGEGGARWK